MSGKGKTRWHPDDASAHSGRGRAAVGPAMREGGGAARDPTFCAPVLGGVVGLGVSGKILGGRFVSFRVW